MKLFSPSLFSHHDSTAYCNASTYKSPTHQSTWRRLRPGLVVALISWASLFAPMISPASADTPDEQWAFANGLYTQKLWGLAAENLDKFVKANPNHPQAKRAAYQLAAAIFRNDDKGKTDYAGAAAAYERALKEYPDPKLGAVARFELADAYFNLKDFARAAATFGQFLATQPGAEQGAEAAYMQGESFYALKKPTEARAAYAKVLSTYPTSRPAPYAQLAIGTLAEESGQMAQAAAAYQTVWQKYPQSEVVGEARLRGANVLLSLSKWKEAGAQFEAVLTDPKLSKWKSDALLGLADAQFGAKDWRGAGAAYEQALAALPAKDARRAALQIRLADSFFNAKDWTRAVASYTPQVASGDAKIAANALYFRARSLGEAGRKNEAIKDFESLLERFPTHSRASRAALYLGDLYAEAKDAVRAAEAYRVVLTKYPQSKEVKDAQESLVDLAGNLGQSSSSNASGDLEKVLRSLPPGRASGNAQLRLAQAAYARGDWAKTAQLAQGALGAKPDAATTENALYLLASAQYNTAQLAPSAATFRRQLASYPKGSLAPSAHLGLSWALLDAKKWSEAQTAARTGITALQKAPKTKENADLQTRLKLALGEALWRGKSYAPAAATLALLSNASDKEIAAQSTFGAASSYEALNQWPSAAAQWAKYAAVVKEPPEQARGFLRRGLALSKAKEAASKTAALAAFDRAATLDPKGDLGARALYESAWAATDMKQAASAASRWAKLAANYPESKFAATAHFQIGENHFAAKRWDEAAAAYRNVTENYGQSEEAPLAWYQLGSAMFNAQNWLEAGTAFERAASFPKSEVAVEASYWAGQSASKAGDVKVARPHYEKFLAQLALKPQANLQAWAPIARVGVGRALLESGDAARAESTLRAALQGAKGAVAAEANYHLGQALRAQNKWKEAAAQGLKVTTLFPQSEWAPRAAWLAAEATEKSGETSSAIVLYRAIADKQPENEWSLQAQERLKALGAS